MVLRRGLERQGFLLLRGLLPAGEVADASRQVLRVLARHGWTRPNATDAILTFRRRLVPATLRQFESVYRDLQATEEVHRLVRAPRLQETVDLLIGPSVNLPQRVIRTTMPVGYGGPANLAIHADSDTFPSTVALTTWIPLTRCPIERGGVCIDIGSHRSREHEPALLAAADFELGDVVLLVPSLLHGALPNRTRDRLRVSVDCRWQPKSAPIEADLLQPDGGTSWHEYTAGWSSTEWITV